MKIIQPSFEILEQEHGIQGVYKQIELAGRTCYKSEDKITDDSAEKFVARMRELGHLAMMEHGTVYLYGPRIVLYPFDSNPYSRYIGEGMYAYVTTNYRVIEENKWHRLLKYICDPTPHHIKRVSVKFICNRQVSHEFVRHRVFSFAQESTRFCNYSKDKFGNELTFIQPCWDDCEYNPYNWDDVPEDFVMLYKHLLDIETIYNALIDKGWTAQEAATILPNALKTELIMTGFVDDNGWKHFFQLRADGVTGTPHPQAWELAAPLQRAFIRRKLISRQ